MKIIKLSNNINIKVTYRINTARENKLRNKNKKKICVMITEFINYNVQTALKNTQAIVVRISRQYNE
jgi:hypothetical protein